MKKILLASTIGLFTIGAINAQTPERTAKSVVYKFTETWCGPCGDWGWDLAENILSDIGDKGYYVGVMGSSSPSSMNANCYSAFQSNYPISGYPTFVVNNTDGGYYISGIRNLYNSFSTSTPVAQSAGKFDIIDGVINVTVNTKFWDNTSGQYFIAAHIVEDKVKAAQASQPGTPEHHYIMRGTMMADNSPWGQELANGPVAANTEFTKTFSATMKSGWNADNISILLTIFKKEGSSYTFVNAMKAVSTPTSIADNSALNKLTLSPNPAGADGASLNINLNKTQNADIFISDISGRIVYSMNNQQILAGESIIKIPTFNLANGHYSVTIKGENLHKVEALIVNK